MLANLFMHYAFDMWLDREYPGCAFERYADDAVIHCATERQARSCLADSPSGSIGGTELPHKTKIVYCQDTKRRGEGGAHQLRLPRLHLSGPPGLKG